MLRKFCRLQVQLNTCSFMTGFEDTEAFIKLTMSIREAVYLIWPSISN